MSSTPVEARRAPRTRGGRPAEKDGRDASYLYCSVSCASSSRTSVADEEMTGTGTSTSKLHPSRWLLWWTSLARRKKPRLGLPPHSVLLSSLCLLCVPFPLPPLCHANQARKQTPRIGSPPIFPRPPPPSPSSSPTIYRLPERQSVRDGGGLIATSPSGERVINMEEWNRLGALLLSLPLVRGES